MNFLFVHQNFPGQYRHAVRYLTRVGHSVTFLTQGPNANDAIPGLRKIAYRPPPRPAAIHHYLADLESGMRNGLAVAEVCERLKKEGFRPDLMIGHNGWGEILYLKDVWPSVPLLGYFEFFFHAMGADVGCDPEFPPAADDGMRLRMRNALNLLGLEAADWAQTPTEWQLKQYPRRYWPRFSVIHEGIDAGLIHPDPSARLWLEGGLSLSREDEVITYSARNLEPYRGFHVFMRALPEVLKRRPQARVLIVGGDGVSYGRRPSQTSTWRQVMLAELEGKLDLERIHFVGRLGYEHYLAALQLSSVHVYLTYPFVLSWSLLEAMAAGCRIVASATPPVEEVIKDGDNGYLVPFPDPQALALRIVEVLGDPHPQSAVRTAARETVIARYELATVALPAYLDLLRKLSGARKPL